MITARADLTFKENLKHGRHSWLRLTPAYSVKVVQDILIKVGKPSYVLDPFSGTGTTGLACAERGIACDLVELNPFLGWFAKAKTRNYTERDIAGADEIARAAAARVGQNAKIHHLWTPPISHIERWWTPNRLAVLASLFHDLRRKSQEEECPALDLVLIAFCRVAIAWSNAAFNHQSMSLKCERPTLFEAQEGDMIVGDFLTHTERILSSAKQPLLGRVTVHRGDSRHLTTFLTGPYSCIITSPPYPNRMSYVRELRPYMYWLGYLKEAREAGDLDWKAIGGTWGIATSRLAQWTPNGTTVRYAGFKKLIGAIAQNSPLLANYVHKYFVDVADHLKELVGVISHRARVFYIVGNSKFYNTTVPVEQMYASLMAQCGLENIRCEPLRKRSSKKELYEFVVSAEWNQSTRTSCRPR